MRIAIEVLNSTTQTLSRKSIVIQQLRFITCGIVGMWLFGCSLPVESAPPLPPKNSSTPSLSTPKPTSNPATPSQKLPLSAQITINGQSILLEVARTSEEQSMGLMNRTELAANRGMLFVFSPPRAVSFWMKNTLIPLDMIFVSNGVVKHIGANIPPCKVSDCPGYGPEPKIPIDSVIELRGGRSAELRLKVGDRVKIDPYSAKMLK
ncbi:DUF192 domain-containing protein [Chamaesiphon sp. VAR_48_metabat_403]|uniref:DUF192 domain-containing protein n=1 Tax=Chamaesiphon sp. VAR_48_metabat_403 TaxID=2964700 RepID=UPI00286E058E|nr:DUF192 domain-containing protein [Chamaesiphon sp. VAR_48_metabat_403]